jgi:alkanesulfonate monooxygenase SsuD/methylene tetrahydromethanopterin reductase-like flavin-dependent oxidoreductase (luciferase family)
MRFGLSIPNFGDSSDPRILASLAHDAEAAGWDGFFLWDHVLFTELPHSDPWIALAAIALQTERIRIGPLVTPVPRRRPVKLAREAVTVDRLSNGRLILGVGSGFGWEYDGLGEETDPRVRGAMLDEFLDVLTGLWSGEPYVHHGAHYHVEVRLPWRDEPAAFLPTPVQQPRIPIWVAGMWPNKPPFRRAARWDGVVPISVNAGPDPQQLTPDDLRAIVTYTRRRRAGTDPFEVITYGVTPHDPIEAGAQVAPYAEAGVTWWIDDLSPWSFGWQPPGPWPTDAIRARIQAGPPRS